jgi:hypothetical protein
MSPSFEDDDTFSVHDSQYDVLQSTSMENVSCILLKKVKLYAMKAYGKWICRSTELSSTLCGTAI